MCKAILIAKNVEYARDEDKLSNFKKAAGLLGVSQEEALLGMYIKHLVSVTDYIQDIPKGVEYELHKWDEKIVDVINYTILLRAMIIEGLDKESEEKSQCQSMNTTVPTPPVVPPSKWLDPTYGRTMNSTAPRVNPTTPTPASYPICISTSPEDYPVTKKYPYEPQTVNN